MSTCKEIDKKMSNGKEILWAKKQKGVTVKIKAKK